VNPGEDHPPASECSFDDCGGSVGILTDNRAPAGKLRAILPVLIERWCSSTSNRHRCLADTPTFGGVETEPHTCGQIQTVIAGIPSKETTRTDSEVIQTILYGVANVRGCARSQAVADVNEISTRNNQQTISRICDSPISFNREEFTVE
jgi:hypothetical protein